MANPRPAAPPLYLLHDNEEWLAPFRAAFDGRGVEVVEWDMNCCAPQLDLRSAPPRGVFFNRVSPSSHLRGGRYVMEFTSCVVAWLEQHGRRVVNGSNAMLLEMSKVKQELAMQMSGVPTPWTFAAPNKRQVMEAVHKIAADGSSFLLKHNRGGSGGGVRLFHTPDAAAKYVESELFALPCDGVTLIQQLIVSPEQAMYRLEFVGGKLVYAVRVDTSTLAAGESVNNCPSDVCQAKEDATRDSGDGNEGTAEGNPEATLATATEHAAALALVTTRAVLYAKASCKWCRRVKEVLDAIQLPYTEFAVGRDVGVAVVEQRAGQPVRTVPQVFVDGVYVGGHDDTVAAIAAGDVVGADPLPTNFSSSVSSDNDDDGEQSTGNAAHLSLGVAVGHCPLTTSSEKFRIMPTDWTHAIVPQLEQLLVANRVDIGAVELVIDAEGDAFVIDWNCCNTNYNQRAEAIAGLENFGAAGECAAFFEAELAKVVVGVSLPSPELPPYVATR